LIKNDFNSEGTVSKVDKTTFDKSNE